MNGGRGELGFWSVAVYSHLDKMCCGSGDNTTINYVKSPAGGRYEGGEKYFGQVEGV